MTHPDAQLWNTRYLNEQEHYLKREPYSLVCTYADHIPAGGLVLEVAAGTAPAGITLARRGLRMILLDISETGLRLAQNRARELSLSLSLAVMDMSEGWLPPARFDAILNFYYLSRPLFECYRKALKPGGLLFFETLVQDPARKSNPAHTLVPGELKAAFNDWEIIHSAEIWKRQRGNMASSRKIAQLVARKTI